jgi:hypothetical protein
MLIIVGVILIALGLLSGAVLLLATVGLIAARWPRPPCSC